MSNYDNLKNDVQITLVNDNVENINSIDNVQKSEVASYISSMVKELSQMSKNNDMTFLSHLLDAADKEAEKQTNIL